MNKHRAHVAIVHGAGLSMVDGVVAPSTHSMVQVIAGERLLQDGVVDMLLLSGMGLPANTDSVSEAGAMKNYLIDRDIPEENILVEAESLSTLGNWAHSAALLETSGYETVLGVARPATLPRAYMCGRFVAARSEILLVGYEASDEALKPTSVLREVISTALLAQFLMTHRHEAVDTLPEAYEVFKDQYWINSIKKKRYTATNKDQ